MSTQITLTLPDALFERARRYADSTDRPISTVLVESLQIPEPLNEEQPLDSEEDAAIRREEAAYIRLHPQLKETHFGRYVAIYGGELIDEADEFGELARRIRQKYPNEFVWITPVREEAIETLHFRSPRLIS